MNDIILTTRNLTKYFDDFLAVDHLNLDVRKGELVALLGPSGCGKTTTLRMVAGLARPSDGEIVFENKTLVSVPKRVYLPPEKRDIGMVFQSYALWPHMTVAQNVGYPLKLRRVKSQEIRDRVVKVLRLIGLDNLIDQTIPQLSGGQQQRVALARALVYEPSLMLFDEPFSNLDAQLRGQMRMELKSLRRKVDMTGFFVTHDQVEALSLADRVAIMRDGKIEQMGGPMEVYKSPATRFVRDFLGSVVNLHGIVQDVESSGAVKLGLAGDPNQIIVANNRGSDVIKAGDRVEISIRPEYIDILPDSSMGQPNAVSGTIGELLFTGEHFDTSLNIGSESVVMELPTGQAWDEGQKVTLGLKEDAISLWKDEAVAA